MEDILEKQTLAGPRHVSTRGSSPLVHLQPSHSHKGQITTTGISVYIKSDLAKLVGVKSDYNCKK